MKKIQRTKKQHYISESILKVFFRTNKIHEYFIKNGNNYDSSTDDCMCCSDLYEINFLEDNTLEKFFAKSYDNQFSTKLHEVDELLNLGKVNDAKSKIKALFYYYLIGYYKSLASLVRFRINSDSKTEKDISTSKMLKVISDDSYMNRITMILLNCYNIYIIKSFKSNFVICDQFISTVSNHYNGQFVDVSNRDIGIKGSIVLLPVSIDYYFLLYDNTMSGLDNLDSESINCLSEFDTEKINNIIYNNATEKLCTCKNQNHKFTNVNSYGDEEVFFDSSNGLSRGFRKKKEIFYSDYEQDVYDLFTSLKWADYKNIKRNDACFCGSNKKSKRCCFNKINRCKIIMDNIRNKSISYNSIINKTLGTEFPVELK